MREGKVAEQVESEEMPELCRSTRSPHQQSAGPPEPPLHARARAAPFDRSEAGHLLPANPTLPHPPFLHPDEPHVHPVGKDDERAIRLQHSSCSADSGASIVNNRSDRWCCQRTGPAGVGVFVRRRRLNHSSGSAGVLLTLHRSTRQTEPMSYGCQQLGLL